MVAVLNRLRRAQANSRARSRWSNRAATARTSRRSAG